MVTSDLMKSGGQDWHQEAIVDVSQQLVSDVSMGHLEGDTQADIRESDRVCVCVLCAPCVRACVRAFLSTCTTALQNSSELRNCTRGGMRAQSSPWRQCHSSLGTSSLVGRDE